jgi:hypothetical protein
MAVNLSPIGGVAAQFLDNSGNPLSGGKIFTYAAGTTTPQATYTSSSGVTAHSNPIILDAAGRVPSGEIWLADGLQYKFLIKTSADVQIGSYDNIIGINSNFVNYTNSQEIQTATAGKTVFTLTTMVYQPGTNSLSVFVDGVNQYGPGALYAYQETSDTVVTFTSGLHAGAEVKFTTSAINASSYGDAEQVSYTPPYTNSVTTNVELKLAQTVSVKDFGAVGNGVADDTVALKAAVASGAASVFIPAGTYRFNDTLNVTAAGLTIYGEGTKSILQFFDTTGKNAISVSAVTNNYRTIRFADFSLTGTATCGNGINYTTSTSTFNLTAENLNISGFKASGKYGIYIKKLYNGHFTNIKIVDCANGIALDELVLFTIFETIWIWNIDRYSIHSLTTNINLFSTYFINTVISNDAKAPGQTGIYIEKGILDFIEGHIEQIDTPFYCAAGTGINFDDTSFPVLTNAPTLVNGSKVAFNNCDSTNSITAPWVAALGTTWTNNKIRITNPSFSLSAGQSELFIGANNLPASGVDISNPTGTVLTVYGFNSTNAPLQDTLTLYFQDSNIIIYRDGAGAVVNAITLAGNLDWRPMNGDTLTLRKGRITASNVYWEEVSRAEKNKVVNIASATYDLYSGDGNRVFTNSGATGQVDLLLPDTNSTTIGTTITFVKNEPQTFRIDPFGTEAIRGGGAGKYLQLTNTGDSVTLYNSVNNRWEILTSYGPYTFEP